MKRFGWGWWLGFGTAALTSVTLVLVAFNSLVAVPFAVFAGMLFTMSVYEVEKD